MHFARRDMLKLAGTGTLLAASTGCIGKPLRAQGTPGDYASDADRLRTTILMRGALDDRLCINWMRARYYGVIGDEMTPLFGVVAAVFNRFRQTADGGYQYATREVAYFTDHDCTQALDTYENPYTGEVVSIPEGGLPATAVRITPDLHHHLVEERPGVEMDHVFYPIYISGDEVWLTESENAAVSIPGAGSPFRYQDVATYHAPVAAVQDPEAKAVSSLVGYSSVTSWRPWLNMPRGTGGHLSAFGSGRTNSRLEDIPQPWLDATATRNPHLLDDPMAALDSAWNL